LAETNHPSERISFPNDPRDGEGWDLSGDLTRMPLISVLQFLELSRHTGVLLLSAPDGRVSQCVLKDGAIVDASHRHLRGREALLGLLEWKAGRFAFGAREVPATLTQRTAISPLIMETVRLEDELERAMPAFPGENVPLALRNPHEVPMDPLDCGADSVMAAIAARPGVTVVDLERTLALAPSRVRLSVAWLSLTGRLRSRGSMGRLASMPKVPGPDDWYQRLLLQFPGGLRVVLATAPEQAMHDIIASITQLAKVLDSGPAWMSLAADGAAMARVRPRLGGLLSLACLPMMRAHAEAFKTFAATANLVLLCDPGSPELYGAWQSLVPPHIGVHPVHCDAAGSSLVDALRESAPSLSSTPPRPEGGE
jgi:hypothetical protein